MGRPKKKKQEDKKNTIEIPYIDERPKNHNKKS
jgi:hypothetical protein